jgi:hypothetical protein
VGVNRVGRPINAAMSRAERTLLFIRCTLLWVEHNHRDIAQESQPFCGVCRAGARVVI